MTFIPGVTGDADADDTALRVFLASYYDESYPPWVFTPPVAPTLTSLTPSSIVVGTPTRCDIVGANFRINQTQVYVDGVGQPSHVDSPTAMWYTAEASSVGSQDVEVRNGSLASASLVMTVTATVGVQAEEDPAPDPPPDPPPE